MISLYQGNCLEIMKNIPDNSVDMILCDLPYGTTACKWDTIIPFDLLWREYNRIINGSGAIVLTATQPFTTKLLTSNIENFKYTWIWEKSRPSGFAHAKNMPLKNYEDIIVFSSGKTGHIGQVKNRVPYNPQGLVYSPRTTRNTKVRGDNESSFGNRPSHKDSYVQEYTNYPNQILKFNSVTGAQHPTQKPVELMEYMIKTYINEWQTVLDNCMGSGTTGLACKNLNRKFIGIELDETYFNIAKERIENSGGIK